RAALRVPEPSSVALVRGAGKRPSDEPVRGEKRREPISLWLIGQSSGVFSLVTFFARAKKVTRPQGRNSKSLDRHASSTLAMTALYLPEGTRPSGTTQIMNGCIEEESC